MPKKISSRSHKTRRHIRRPHKQLRLLARGDGNREFLVGLLIFILIGMSVTGAIFGVRSGAISNIIHSGTPQPKGAPHETLTMALGQSKGVNWAPQEKWGLDGGVLNWAGVESDIKDMQNAGITWVRIRLSSTDANTDKLVMLLKDHGIRILAIIESNPPKTKGNFFQRLFYRDAVKKIAVHYIDTVQYYEVGNEPNHPDFWNIDIRESSSDAEYTQAVSDYIDHLKETVVAIKSGNPNAVVFLGGLSDESVNRWLDAFISQNGYTYIDGVSFHVKASNPTEIGQKVHALKIELAKVAEFAVKQIWVTDFGFTTDSKDNSIAKVPDEKTKADYVLQSFAAIRGEGLNGPIFWKRLEENENDKPGYGLVMKNASNLNTTYLPAYDMLKSF